MGTDDIIPTFLRRRHDSMMGGWVRTTAGELHGKSSEFDSNHVINIRSVCHLDSSVQLFAIVIFES
jgi:hypothetical protein